MPLAFPFSTMYRNIHHFIAFKYYKMSYLIHLFRQLSEKKYYAEYVLGFYSKKVWYRPHITLKFCSLLQQCHFSIVVCYCWCCCFRQVMLLFIVRHYENLPAEGWQQYINCGQWPTTGGPTHAIPLPNLSTKRVPITQF